MSLKSAVVTAESGRGDSNTAGKHFGLALAVISAAQLMIVLDNYMVKA